MTYINPLVESGQYERTYVGELVPGDILASGETVREIIDLPNEYVGVRCVGFNFTHSYHRSNTLLTRVTA